MGIFWTDPSYKYLVSLKAKADKRLQTTRWEQGLHSDQLCPHKHSHLQIKHFSERSLFYPPLSHVRESRRKGDCRLSDIL